VLPPAVSEEIDTQHAKFQKKNHVAKTSSSAIDSAALAVWASSDICRYNGLSQEYSWWRGFFIHIQLVIIAKLVINPISKT
jgi:hypothetical protein